MYGWRVRIGHVAPSRGDTLVYEFYQMLPAGFMILNSTGTIRQLVDADIDRQLQRIEEAAADLVDNKCDSVIIGGSPLFTKSLALEHVKDGLNINAIAPGRIKTDKVRGHYSSEAWAAAEAQIPMGRAGAPEDIASAALFLVNDENKYITGQTIHVNGAWLNW